ncbi:hypothetical protein [Citrobacter rodentium]|jgi:hypothetical protein|uniref:Uncharacterized protein n=2 Tax=Citrobacter rodentium TaxID=67825 RepID=D2TJP8_CITRI|nr:hypothetical protein [Citrobacter rodentium]QBY29396.1 hypothetical protein E2R62_11370 [Citrobacter rodentium]UHO33202.1 hypothetical protein K7R23_11625 [Citrobacter rodentium NBRC 105723 = DSM 16636]CBG89689.1 hypothetical protein ROD_29501 [Citrobacter rodentium ICC168]HAT8015792.1 hypothetical protein [Citrobacter rodentium NBRC 105723 = DSM 16636]HAT8017470.1 hypothetical protein [Citrobacter rodentium]
MDVISVSGKQAQLTIRENGLIILNTALNEICNGISVPESKTRIGISKEEVCTLINDISLVLDNMIV